MDLRSVSPQTSQSHAFWQTLLIPSLDLEVSFIALSPQYLLQQIAIVCLLIYKPNPSALDDKFLKPEINLVLFV